MGTGKCGLSQRGGEGAPRDPETEEQKAPRAHASVGGEGEGVHSQGQGPEHGQRGQTDETRSAERGSSGS